MAVGVKITSFFLLKDSGGEATVPGFAPVPFFAFQDKYTMKIALNQ